MNAKYNAFHIANWFILKGKQDSQPLTNLKVLKLVYLAYGFYLAIAEKKLFDEPVEAWKHGPVIPSIYHTLKYYGRSNIDEPIKDAEGMYQVVDVKDSELIDILSDGVWYCYAETSAAKLVALTHKEGTPWAKHYQPGYNNVIIEDDTIKAYWQKRLLPDEG